VSGLVQFDGVERAALPARPLHLAIGMFDGVHLGHRAVIEAAVKAARGSGGTAVVLTFWPHPSALFRPENPTPLIQEVPAKRRVIAGLGVEAMVTQPFTREFAGLKAEEFLPWLKRHLPTLAAIYVGENFRFGQGRRGDVAQLMDAGRALGVGVLSAPRVNFAGEPISSTRIRALLAAGEMAAANALLGYAYFADGVVTPGKKLGRGIGFPTLNLPWAPGLRPRLGVYAVRVAGPKASGSLAGIANYGLRPTVEASTAPRLETHVLGECPFEAGDEITVEWLRFVRPEMKFSGLEELRAQIARDVAAARAELG
jgi:riboflavin kinase / FMN adenylyltransferase